MRNRTAVLAAACVAIAGIAASPAAAAPKVVKAKFRASYTFAAISGSSWDLPAEGFCPGVHWDENARGVVTHQFRPLKLALESDAHAVASGASLVDGDWSAHGNYYPDNDCGAQPQQSQCSGVVDYAHPESETPLLAMVVKKGTVIIASGAG